MQKIHFYFFCLYNFSYKDGFNKKPIYSNPVGGKGSPESAAVTVLSFCSWLWTVAIRLIIIALFKPNFKILFLGPFEIIIPLIIFLTYTSYFINGSRFIDIYIKYKEVDKSIQKQTVKKVFYFLGLPLILIPLLAWGITNYMHIDLTNH